MKLFYTKQASKWEETLPIGNGSLGAMIYGNTKKECLGLNEESVWSGYYKDKNNAKAIHSLEECRRLVEAGEFVKAEKLIQDNMLGEYNESYLPLGNLFFEFAHAEQVANYSRSLDIEKAVANISYEVDGVTYKREYFASYPKKALFVKLEASKPVMDFAISFESELSFTTECCDKEITIALQCPEHVDPSYVDNSANPIVQGDKGMKVQAKISLLQCDGTVNQGDQGLHISNASSVILAFAAVKEAMIESTMDYEAVKAEHIADYQAIYNKVEFYMGEQSELPTDERLERLRKGEEDNALYALYFQYGRYLLIASSREGSLPANLQGIWSWKFRAPWSSNWTTNINAQMNYWHAQSCNLVECLQPYFDLVGRLCEEGKKTAKIHYNARGFVHHHNADYWCNTSPVGIVHGDKGGEDGSATWSMWPMGGAWMTSELFKHYEYNQDKTFLKETAYPILKEAALFLVDWLYEYKGQYVTCPSTSPENRFRTKDGETSCIAMSSAMDLAITLEVFQNFQKTCSILEIEDELLEEIAKRIEKIAPFQVGSKGQLLEWHEELEEDEPGHRHISHLYGMFPGELFEGNKELTEACRTSLRLRLENGGGHTGWSCAWIINEFAILGDSKNAYKYLNTLLTRSSYDNLWDAHPPFQIDGNFGGTAGIANMLVQDRNGEVKLLPAWPKEFKDGYVKGLRIKHGKTIDISWKDGVLESHKIY